MSSENKRIYLILMGIFIAVVILVIVAFSLIPPLGPEGYYITIGNNQIEWMFAILMLSLIHI